MANALHYTLNHDHNANQKVLEALSVIYILKPKKEEKFTWVANAKG